MRTRTWHGSKWIRSARRLGIYLRDGLACVYCGEGIEEGAQLTLDHLRCHTHGGGNSSSNLVTACKRCNSSRGCRPVAEFCRAVAEYVRADADEILRRVRNAARRQVDTAEARRLIARRGNISSALGRLSN